MATLPIKCDHCGTLRLHYGACSCPRALLDTVRGLQASLRRRLANLENDEREILALLGDTIQDQQRPING